MYQFSANSSLSSSSDRQHPSTSHHSSRSRRGCTISPASSLSSSENSCGSKRYTHNPYDVHSGKSHIQNAHAQQQQPRLTNNQQHCQGLLSQSLVDPPYQEQEYQSLGTPLARSSNHVLTMSSSASQGPSPQSRFSVSIPTTGSGSMDEFEDVCRLSQSQQPHREAKAEYGENFLACNIKVKDLPCACTKHQLKLIFETHFGPVEATIVMLDRKGRSRRYGFVLMQHATDAAHAIRQISDVGLRIYDHIVSAHLSNKHTTIFDRTLMEYASSGNCNDVPSPPSDSATPTLAALMQQYDTQRIPLPPNLDNLSWSEELEQSEAATQVVNQIRRNSRMKLPLKERNVKKYFHRFLDAPDTPQQIKDDFYDLARQHQMEVYKALCHAKPL